MARDILKWFFTERIGRSVSYPEIPEYNFRLQTGKRDYFNARKDLMPKLIRDKIPEIMRSKNQYPLIKIAENDEEYFCSLKAKLVEEVNEFIEACTSTTDAAPEEELADILEVIDALCKFKNYDTKTIQNKKAEKFLKIGGFDNRIILN